MYLVYTVVKSALAQQEVISLLPHKEQFKDYYQTRTKKDKDRIDSFFDSCDVQRFRRLELIMAVAKPFHDTYMLLSSRDCPMSAYPLAVRALYNEFHDALFGCSGKFDRIMGAGCAIEVFNAIKERFNFTAEEIPGRKVGFLDKYQLMCLICDPYYYYWRPTFKLERSVKLLAKKMVEHFVPRLEERSVIKQQELLKEFMVSS